MREPKKIPVEVEFTEGYQERFVLEYDVSYLSALFE